MCNGGQEAGIQRGKEQKGARFQRRVRYVFPFSRTACADVTPEEGRRGGQVRRGKLTWLGGRAVTEWRIGLQAVFEVFLRF